MIRFTTIENQIACDYPTLKAEMLKKREGFLDVLTLEKGISNQQMRFFHGCVVKCFTDFTGDSKGYWETMLKLECGSKWFSPEIITVGKFPVSFIPSKTHLTTRQFMEWYQNIVDFGLEKGVIVPAPDPEWRKNKEIG